MSLKNVTSPEKNISVLELHIDKAAFDDAVTKAYKKNVGKMNVPGFRKGKAPKSIIEKMYGAAVFYDDALDMLLPDLYASAVEEAKLEVVSRPEIDIVSIDENGVELTAKVYTKPVATVSKYKGLEAAKETVRVNKSEIEEEIELVRKRNGRQITLEPFRTGCVLVLHRDHDGGGNAVEIAVSHKAAHDGIHRHIELRALEIRAVAHIRKDSFRVLVERRTDEHLFASIHLQLNARVHVQRHHGGHRVCPLVEQPSAEQHHRKAGGNE